MSKNFLSFRQAMERLGVSYYSFIQIVNRAEFEKYRLYEYVKEYRKVRGLKRKVYKQKCCVTFSEEFVQDFTKFYKNRKGKNYAKNH